MAPIAFGLIPQRPQRAAAGVAPVLLALYLSRRRYSVTQLTCTLRFRTVTTPADLVSSVLVELT